MVLFQALFSSEAFVTPLEKKSFLTKLHATSSSRRQLLDATILSAAAVLLLPKNPAIAAYGDSSTMQVFDYIDYLVEKNSVADPATFLYKGADREVQLKRMSDAIASLKQISGMAEAKKWSQVQGVLTGPLGTLLQTMNQIIGKDASKEQKAAATRVKMDLYAIGTAATKKSDTGCLEATQAALKDLETFVKVAF